jgi:hypothetical protein
VIGERIRDKFAASRKKGMWMGSFVPLGFGSSSSTRPRQPSHVTKVGVCRFIVGGIAYPVVVGVQHDEVASNTCDPHLKLRSSSAASTCAFCTGRPFSPARLFHQIPSHTLE